MPLYEYECRSCGHRMEVLQRVDAPPPESCECGESGTLKKLVSAPAFQFKGEGWYVTDYARKKADGNGKGETSEAKGADAKGTDATGKSATEKSATEKSGGGSPPENKGPRGMTKPEVIQQKSPPKSTSS